MALKRHMVMGVLALACLAADTRQQPHTSPSTQVGSAAATVAVPRARKLEVIASRAIFWGHRSVGENVLRGLQRLMLAYPQSGLAVLETDRPSRVRPGVLAHALIGPGDYNARNKIRAFDSLMRGGMADAAQIAGVKLCFTDGDVQLDPAGVFMLYKETLEALKKRYPKVRFVHFTIPVTLYATEAENPSREVYNELLRREPAFKGDGMLDIAAWECQDAAGRCIRDGKGNRMLRQEYTEDNVHPDKRVGEDWLAANLIDALYEVAR